MLTKKLNLFYQFLEMFYLICASFPIKTFLEFISEFVKTCSRNLLGTIHSVYFQSD